MIELIALAVAATVGIYSHVRVRDFTRRRLRYTRIAEHPAAGGLLVGVGAALIAVPVVGLLPVVGTGTALALGAGMGTGVAVGSRSRPAYD